MVRVLEADDGFAPCVDASQPHRQVIRLAAAVDKVADAKRRWELRLQLLCIPDNRRMEVARVADDVVHRTAAGIDEMRVAVPDVADVAVAVDVHLRLIVKAVLHGGLYKHKGLRVEVVLTSA